MMSIRSTSVVSVCVLMLLCIPAAEVRADYSFAADARGRAQCSAIFSGTVVATDKIEDADSNPELWAVTVRVRQVEKGQRILPGMLLTLYYRCARPPARIVCPAQVKLSVGETKAFFAMTQDLPGRHRALYLPSAEHVRPETAI